MESHSFSEDVLPRRSRVRRLLQIHECRFFPCVNIKMSKRHTLFSKSRRGSATRTSRCIPRRYRRSPRKRSKACTRHASRQRVLKYRSAPTPTNPESFELFKLFIRRSHPDKVSIIDPIRDEMDPHTRLLSLLRATHKFNDVPDPLKIAIANEMSELNSDHASEFFDAMTPYIPLEENSVEVRRAVLNAFMKYPTFSFAWASMFNLIDFNEHKDKVDIAYLKTFSSEKPDDLTDDFNEDVALLYFEALLQRITNGYPASMDWLDVFDGIEDPSDEIRNKMRELDIQMGGVPFFNVDL